MFEYTLTMQLAQISELEELCGARLPHNYLRLLSNYPPALRTAVRAEDDSCSEGTVAEVELMSELSDLVEINREVRLGPVLDPKGVEFRWPVQLLVIGETGDGDYYCVDTDGEHQGVLQFRHQSVEFENVADSLDEFVGMLLDSYVTGEESAKQK